MTSRLVAAARAREGERPDRLFVDPFAGALAGPEGFAALERSEESRGGDGRSSDPYLAIRTRFLDDALMAALKDVGAGQVVLAAAGMDARAFRLPLPPDLHVYEMDRPDVLAWKRDVLGGLGARPACHRHEVGVDLTRPWGEALRAAGFRPDEPSLWLAEGLLMYLDEPEAASFLDRVAEQAAPGSWIAADVVSRNLLRSPHFRRWLDYLDRAGSPWRFGTNDPEAFFAFHGWRPRTVEPGDPRAHFGRWPYPRAPRLLPGIPRSFFVLARRR
jgi:methyltransferase (TIGR00027 family)